MRIHGLPPTLGVIVCLFLAAPSFAQDKGPSCDVPLVVTRFVPSSRTVEFVKDLDRKDLIVQLGTVSVSAESLSIDDGPKRVALVLDASRRIPKNEWKLETEMAASFVEHARSKDTFGLVLVGLDSTTGPFLSASEVRKQLRQLASSRPAASDSGERINDALLTAANSLNPPMFGDAVFLFGHPDDSDSSANSDQVQALILKNRLRFYGLSFFDPTEEKLPPGFDPNKPLPANIVLSKLEKLSNATGYFFSFQTVKSLSWPGQIQLRKDFLAELYAGIAAPYRVGISGPSMQDPVALTISVTKLEDRKIRTQDIHYPHFIYSCTVASR